MDIECPSTTSGSSRLNPKSPILPLPCIDINEDVLAVIQYPDGPREDLLSAGRSTPGLYPKATFDLFYP